MRRAFLPLAVCLLLMVGLALAQHVPGASEPPQGVPPVFWAILGVILPWIFQTFLSRLPGWLKFVASWGICFVVVAFVGFVFLHYTPAQFLAAVGWLILVMQAVYQLMTKPAAKAAAVKAENNSTKAREAALR